MSFEGRYQKLCPNNHYEEQDVYMETNKCEICGEKWVKSNLVDDTNEVGKGFDFAMASVHITENDLLKSQLKKALEVIRFYAEGGHWGVQDTSSSVAIDPCDWCDNNGTETFRGGKRAREFLKKLEE